MNSQKARHADRIDHVERVVQNHFDVTDNELTIDGHAITGLARKFGTPIFIYSSRAIDRQIARLQDVLPTNFDLYYSIKANPNASILKLCLDAGCGLEIASDGELFQALDSGCAPEKLLFAGPGKSSSELRAAVTAQIGEIHLESVAEARRLQQVAEEVDKNLKVAVRINPMDGAGGAMRMGGQPSPFGIPEEQLQEAIGEIEALDRLHLTGVHLFMGTQILDGNLLSAQYKRAVELSVRVAEQVNRPLETIDFGGGLGTPYFSHESELDWEQVGVAFQHARHKMNEHPFTANAKGIVEPGRFLVAESGIYVTEVLEVKESRGKLFAICNGGMHHHLAASGNLGQTIKRNFPLAVLNKMNRPSHGTYQIVGPLCTPLDTFGRNVALPEIEPGDLIGVFQSGAYGRTASPQGFLSHATAPEILTRDGSVELIRRRGEPKDWTADQCSVLYAKNELE